MTVTETESKSIEIPIGDWDDATLVHFTAALVNDVQARMRVKGSDTKTLGAFNDAMREAFQASGRISIELVPDPHLFEVGHDPQGGGAMREIGFGEVSWWPALHETATKRRLFSHIDLATARDGQVITVNVPQHWLITRETRVDPSQVVLPNGWASELGTAIGEGLKSLPAPVVENNINLTEDIPPQEVTFKHDPHTGWTTSARIEEAT